MVRRRFAELMALGADEVPLDEAALLISATLQPGLDVLEWMAALDELAADCPTPTAIGIARFLFDDEHFVGNRTAYYDWRNSCLDRVIATRTGIPISLSVVMIEVARRVGVPLVGVGMPTHFLVGVADDPDVFVDPFAGGRLLDRAGARALFADLTSGQVPWQESYLAPTPSRDIVIRMLNNLKSVFAGRADLVRLGLTMELRAAVPELADAEAAEIAVASAIFN
ncbi:MAG TPA: transglutaminase-like domain-containing protein [Ilumatobacteraceae bacterium]|nr:transglutaminase-like domain-containing protein [Ilumatobacteraceae bacterium]